MKIDPATVKVIVDELLVVADTLTQGRPFAHLVIGELKHLVDTTGILDTLLAQLKAKGVVA